VGEAEGAQGYRGALHGLARHLFEPGILSFKTLENRLRELAFLNSGVRIMLEDHRPAEAAAF
jgi:DNA gyrase subunit B